LAAIQAYFAAMDERCVADASENTGHGRFLKLYWQSGAVTTLRFDQAEALMRALPSLNVKNHKDFSTQIFIKSR